ncbi:MAG: CPBP family intramembrane metalloprotease [Verrucomicrobia bacterium]|nr:CPBP family intramembrane metalloprotease [Verrucomicrobiota bacterium]
MAEPPGGDYLGPAVLTHKPWNPESLLWLGCAFMLAMAPGAAFAGLFEDGSIAQMAASVSVLPVAIFVAVGVWLQANRRFYGLPVRLADAFGFATGNTGRCLLFGLATGLGLVLIAMALAVLTSLLIQAFGDQAEPQKLVTLIAEEAAKPDQTGVLVFFVVMAVAVAPIAEEILFRGILYPAIKQIGYPSVAAIGTAILFALFHVNLLTFASLTAVALGLIALYEFTDNLLAPITAHAVFNASNLVMLFWQ